MQEPAVWSVTAHNTAIQLVKPYSHVNQWTVHESRPAQCTAQHHVTVIKNEQPAPPSKWLIASLFSLFLLKWKITSDELISRKTRHHTACKFPCVVVFLLMCACRCLQKRVNSSLSQNVNNCRLMFHPPPLLTTSALVEQLLNACRIHEEKAVISKQVY